MEKRKISVAAYARVSTSHHDQNPDVQLSEIRRYCEARGFEIREEFVDHGYSGGTDARPSLKRLLAAARSRQISAVVVTKMDRLFRSLKHMVTTLDELSELGVQFISIGDQIDLGSASGRLMLGIIASFNEFERALVHERTMAGLAYAKSKGVRLGRPRKCDDEAILRLRSQGMSYSEIERRLGISRPSIRRAIVAAGTKTPARAPKKIE